MTETKPKRYQCRHIFTDGHRCGSICLRGEEFCYYHHTTRRPAQNPRARRGRQSTFDLPVTDPNDRTGLQSTIVEVLRRIASNDIDPRRAGLLLYGLQIASLNLPKPQTAQRGRKTEELETVEEITTHPELGILAPIADADEVKIRPGGALDLLLKAMAPKRTEPIPSDDTHKNAVILTGPQRSGETCFSTAASATATQSPQPITLPTIQATQHTFTSPSHRASFRPKRSGETCFSTVHPHNHQPKPQEKKKRRATACAVARHIPRSRNPYMSFTPSTKALSLRLRLG
jgi:hypothetical protein